MPTYDSFVEYKNDKNQFLSECEENIKSFIILKYGFVNGGNCTIKLLIFESKKAIAKLSILMPVDNL